MAKNRRQHFLNLYYVVLGLLTGVVGNLWVYHFSRWLERHFAPDWDIAFYIASILFALWLFFFIRYILHGLKKSTPKRKEKSKGEKESKGKADTQSLIAEYRALNEATQRRGSDTLLVDSIMIPSSLVIVIFAIQFRTELGKSIFVNLPVAGFVPLLALLLVVAPYILWWTTTKLDNMCFDRMCEIEKELKIKGYRYIRERTKCTTWMKIRRNMWHVLFWLFIISYIVTSYWLFRETPAA